MKSENKKIQNKVPDHIQEMFMTPEQVKEKRKYEADVKKLFDSLPKKKNQ